MVQRTGLRHWRGWEALQRLGVTFAIAAIFLLVLFLPLVTVSHDNAMLCSTPLSLSEAKEPLYTIVNDYGLREWDR